MRFLLIRFKLHSYVVNVSHCYRKQAESHCRNKVMLLQSAIREKLQYNGDMFSAVEINAVVQHMAATQFHTVNKTSVLQTPPCCGCFILAYAYQLNFIAIETNADIGGEQHGHTSDLNSWNNVEVSHFRLDSNRIHNRI